ncbi:MAG: hypothetical protein CVU84_00375 [Firmicutes bacterium HGW-Firmicutes-1]|jgi:hypothetical protein|nr:MAG: hypothetical protein CVU84_00375 [Firmicutes bacterium HGW-Firmicutes-1]
MFTTDCIITENLAGNIELKDSHYHIIWQAINISAAVTIKIQNISDNFMKIRMEIEKEKCTLIEIAPHEERTITVSNVLLIEIQLSNRSDNTICPYASYQIIIHYQLEPTPHKKHATKFSCGDSCWYSL